MPDVQVNAHNESWLEWGRVAFVAAPGGIRLEPNGPTLADCRRGYPLPHRGAP